MTRLFSSLVLPLVCCVVSSTATFADDRGTLIFADDFERSESQEIRDEIGNGWGSNSQKRAAGNKQVDLKDGALFIFIHAAADHAVSVTHPAEFRNGTVELRFMLEHQDDSLGLNFADLQCKEVWAGHLCVAKVSTRDIQIQDLKTGNMDLKIRELRQAKKLPPAIQQLLKAKTARVDNKLQTGQWYTLRVDIDERTLSVSIDGRKLAALSSDGIAHPTKRMLRLAVPRRAVVDDVRIFSR